MKRKTAEEKEKLIKEIEKLGVIEGCRKYGISATTYYDWQKRYTSGGIQALGNKRTTSDKDIKRLEKENAQLKELAIEKDLKILMLSELLKKKTSQWNRGDKS